MSLDKNHLGLKIGKMGPWEQDKLLNEFIALSEKSNNENIKNKLAELFYIGVRPKKFSTSSGMVKIFKSIGKNVQAQSNLGQLYSWEWGGG
jgi:hypothetical protein